MPAIEPDKPDMGHSLLLMSLGNMPMIILDWQASRQRHGSRLSRLAPWWTRLSQLCAPLGLVAKGKLVVAYFQVYQAPKLLHFLFPALFCLTINVLLPFRWSLRSPRSMLSRYLRFTLIG